MHCPGCDGDHSPNTCYSCIQLKEDLKESEDIRERMRKTLDNIAVALRGPAPSNMLYSWNLASEVEALKAKLQLAQEDAVSFNDENAHDVGTGAGGVWLTAEEVEKMIRVAFDAGVVWQSDEHEVLSTRGLREAECVERLLRKARGGG
jgi:hypothetical protein